MQMSIQYLIWRCAGRCNSEPVFLLIASRPQHDELSFQVGSLFMTGTTHRISDSLTFWGFPNLALGNMYPQTAVCLSSKTDRIRATAKISFFSLLY